MTINNNKYFSRDLFESDKEFLEARVRYHLGTKSIVFACSTLCSPVKCSIDVGASVGLFSLMLSQRSSNTYSFEACSTSIPLLKSSLPKRVNVVEAAVSDINGMSKLWIPKRDGVSINTRSSLELEANSEIEEKYSVCVNTVTLDSFIPVDSDVGVVKIDVEGHELSVLKGMINIIKKQLPNIVVECDSHNNTNAPYDTFNLLSSLDYNGYYINDEKIESVENFKLSIHQNKINRKKSVNKTRSEKYINDFIWIHKNNKKSLAALLDSFK